jgi:hypothetical protein
VPLIFGGPVGEAADQPSEYAQKILVHFFGMETFKRDIPGGSAMRKQMRKWMRKCEGKETPTEVSNGTLANCSKSLGYRPTVRSSN